MITDNYDDIIDLPHPTSKTHAPMPMKNRAAQFAPFAALTGLDTSIRDAARSTADDYEHSDEPEPEAYDDI
jgi:hypothetical protein